MNGNDEYIISLSRNEDGGGSHGVYKGSVWICVHYRRGNVEMRDMWVERMVMCVLEVGECNRELCVVCVSEGGRVM